jgi:hypothetical protein
LAEVAKNQRRARGASRGLMPTPHVRIPYHGVRRNVFLTHPPLGRFHVDLAEHSHHLTQRSGAFKIEDACCFIALPALGASRILLTGNYLGAAGSGIVLVPLWKGFGLDGRRPNTRTGLYKARRSRCGDLFRPGTSSRPQRATWGSGRWNDCPMGQGQRVLQPVALRRDSSEWDGLTVRQSRLSATARRRGVSPRPARRPLGRNS